MSVVKEETYTIPITKLVYQGWGFGEVDGFAVFVPNSIPGDVVDAQIILKKRNYAEGKIVTIRTPSSMRIESPCTHYPTCGGCQLINVDYPTQLQFKQGIISDCYFKEFGTSDFPIQPILGSASNTFYRNKMEFSFGQNDQGLYLGLKARGSFKDVVPITRCLLESETANDILKFTAAYFNTSSLSAWDYHAYSGDLRHLMIRHAKTTDTYMINLIAAKNHGPLFETFSQQLHNHFPKIVSIYLTINATSGDRTYGDPPLLLSGQPTIEEKFGALTYQISPLSFFQTNSEQAQILYQTLVDMADVSADDTVLDLYCGTGTIGMYFAPHVKAVIGIEANVSAVENAKENAIQNNCHNMTFIADSVRRALKFNTFEPSVVIVDPPRCGMSPKELMRTFQMKSPKLLYVSCNPTTLFRDLKYLTDNGYRLDFLQPVDMFPNTYHVEIIAKLTRIS